jgi:hypothetical protein
LDLATLDAQGGDLDDAIDEWTSASCLEVEDDERRLVQQGHLWSPYPEEPARVPVSAAAVTWL